ncbi:MAG: Uma2 family endonuclease [Chloroflexi bacterium]|nr:Uma2 family endonuclease [Chloroflexota bacterium]MCI0575230.1 Uma2 family endonuclease [Chloroflexota bacterium]MCI0648849.1 Uma2 family endonuclease [Chloroflexota bacterium]MCI0726604.1 Uma2 family endonuclease [Chloroflexota bacterium]
MTAREAAAGREIKEQNALITGQELARMGDIGPCELVEGRIVPMSPTKIQHGRLESRLARILSAFVEAQSLGEVMSGEVGIYVQRNPDTIRAADLLFISRQRLAQATPDDFLDVAPELVVEIVSPSDRWAEIRRKLREYFATGVNAVLVVEPGEQMISFFHSPTGVEEFALGDTLVMPEILPGFKLVVADLFE